MADRDAVWASVDKDDSGSVAVEAVDDLCARLGVKVSEGDLEEWKYELEEDGSRVGKADFFKWVDARVADNHGSGAGEEGKSGADGAAKTVEGRTEGKSGEGSAAGSNGAGTASSRRGVSEKGGEERVTIGPGKRAKPGGRSGVQSAGPRRTEKAPKAGAAKKSRPQSAAPAAARRRKMGQSSMLEAKLKRQQAEGDVQLLRNRIAHLQAEMRRANSRIDETKKRSNEIGGLKKRHVKTLKRKVTTGRLHDDEAKKSQEATRARREKAAHDRQQALQDKLAAKKAAVAAAKAEKEALRRERMEAEAKREEEKKRLREAVLRREREAKARRQREAEERRAKQRKEYEARIDEERRRKGAADQRVSDLEKVEAELIEQLRKCQEEQAAAYQELEQVLGDDVESGTS